MIARPKMKKVLLFLFIILLFLQFANADSPVKKVYVTSNINPHPPVIDGKLDDPVWAKVTWAGDFIQRDPYEGKEPSQATSFKILYDDTSIYIAIRADDNEPEKIERRMSRRDDLEGVVDYTFENPDFNFLQFRMNLVVRWEYIPGSSLYLVWSQGRTEDSSVGDFSFREGMRDLFSLHPHNVFLIKFSYCFQL